MIMNSSRMLLVSVLLIASLALFFPNVQAQTTRIVELRHPVHVLAGGLEPFTVQAVVSFQDAQPKSSLAVGIVDIDSKPQKIIPGIVTTASPDQCVNQPALQALCVMNLHASSGTEDLAFKIGGILGDQPPRPGTWDLNMTAGLLDSNNTLIAKSVSSVPFEVELTPLSLTVNVPSHVTVAVDGVEQPPGSVTIGVAAGSHNISVSLIAEVDSGTRLRFDRWSDGFTGLNRTVTVRSASAFEAVYFTQYRLTLEGEQGTASGQGWYDAGSTATFSVAQAEPMSGFLGLLGGKLLFQGWYENGRSLTNATSGNIVMSQAHTLTVHWQPDYSMPTAIIAIVVLVIALGLAFAIRKRAYSGKPDRATPVPPPIEPPAQEPPQGMPRARSPRSRSSRSKPTVRRTRRSR